MSAHIILVTGGQRSGKSTFAEQLALSLSPQPLYIATARIWDDEFAERVRQHQRRRGPQWTTCEVEKRLSQCNVAGGVALIDCLTLWATNVFFDLKQPDTGQWVAETLEECTGELQQFIRQEATLIFVTNEIGCGGISSNDAQRLFTDVMGRLNQQVAQWAQEVYLMACGIPVKIKGVNDPSLISYLK